MKTFVEGCVEINLTPELIMFDHWWEVSSEIFHSFICGCMYDVKKKIKIGQF